MENVSSTVLWEASRGFRLMFYLVSPSETTYEHVTEVPNYTQEVDIVTNW